MRAVWQDDPPERPRSAIQVLVSRARRLIGADAVLLRGEGYTLSLGAEDVDLIAVINAASRCSDALRSGELDLVLHDTEAVPTLFTAGSARLAPASLDEGNPPSPARSGR